MDWAYAGRLASFVTSLGRFPECFIHIFDIMCKLYDLSLDILETFSYIIILLCKDVRYYFLPVKHYGYTLPFEPEVGGGDKTFGSLNRHQDSKQARSAAKTIASSNIKSKNTSGFPYSIV